MNTDKSELAFSRAKEFIVGGVNSPVRSFCSVGGVPRFIKQAKGSRIVDIDGNEYIDYVSSWGPMILGHADERVTAAVAKAARNGLSFGAPTEAETRLAEMICERMKSVELVRLVNSGTEAVMSAIRLARGFTGREKIVKAVGGYHGHVDQLLVQAGSGAATLGSPDSGGITNAQAEMTVLAQYNDLAAVADAFDKFGGEIAGVIVEPVAGNMGVVGPVSGYLEGLRELCDKYGAMLIFDEVMTGFRVSRGGAQELFGVDADITTLGKIIGGGLPVGAYGGKREIMEAVSPVGSVYQAGTLSGNPLSVAAGIATLDALDDVNAYEKLEAMSARLAEGLSLAADRAGVAYRVNRVGSMMSGFFSDKAVLNYDDAMEADGECYKKFFHSMLAGGIYLAPSAFEAMFMSRAHSDEDIDYTIKVARKSFEEISLGL